MLIRVDIIIIIIRYLRHVSHRKNVICAQNVSSFWTNELNPFIYSMLSRGIYSRYSLCSL